MKKLNGHKTGALEETFNEVASYTREGHFSSDQYGNGEYLNTFEKHMAELLGFDSALFLPSGVMAQLIAIKIWGDKASSSTFACHETCHLIKHEHDAYRNLLGFEVELVGKIDQVPLADSINSLSKNVSSYILEIPMRHLGGDLPEFGELQKIKEACKHKEIKLHIDGARLFEAATYYKKSPGEIVADCDSLFISFYKGFGSTSGSMLFGTKDFIEEAKVWLRRFGGNLFQLYPLAIPAIKNFHEHKDLFDDWTQKGLKISKILGEKLGINTIPYPAKVNMFHAILPLSKEQLGQNIKSLENEKINARLGVWEETKEGCRVEFTVGTATMEWSDQDIESVFRKLIKKTES